MRQFVLRLREFPWSRNESTNLSLQGRIGKSIRVSILEIREILVRDNQFSMEAVKFGESQRASEKDRLIASRKNELYAGRKAKEEEERKIREETENLKKQKEEEERKERERK